MSHYKYGRRSTNSYRGKRNHRNNNRNRRGPKKQYIDPAKFVKSAKMTQPQEVVIENSFSDFDLHPYVSDQIKQRGFKKPTPIQDQAIPAGLEGKDVIGTANTGTGKTLAFGLPVISKIANDPSNKAIILAPTRELAEQILTEFKSLTRGTKVYWALLIGGSSMHRQIKDLNRNPNLVVGTPGRIKDHIQRKNLDLSDFNITVLDEVDRMLDMGFVNDVQEILSNAHNNRQAYFFSATMDNKVRNLVGKFSNNPVNISVKTSDTSDNVEQDVIKYSNSHEKMEKLHNVLISDRDNKALIFNETRRSVDKLSKELQSRGFKTDTIHGGKSQGQRKRALAKFKDSHTDVLVATDVAARGIDVDDITHVINYTTPQSYDDYTHRIGRTGRAGRKGFAFTFIQG